MGKNALVGTIGLLGLAMVFSSAISCRKTTVGPAEGDTADIYEVIAGVQGSASDDERWAEVWAAGSEPEKAEREKFGKVQPVMDEDSLDVSGDSATFGVEVFDAKSNSLGPAAEWSAVKEGGKWKLKLAPLPAVPK